MKPIVFLLVFASLCQSTFASFPDIGYSWYERDILALQKDGIVNGQPDGTFQPGWSVTRAEFLKMVLGASKTPIGGDANVQCFPDVDPSMWYSSYICAASKLGIANGFSDGTFKPNQTVTDLEALAFGFRAFEIAPKPVANQEWYVAYRELADKNRILAANDYTLATNISRGKAAELIQNLREFQVAKAPLLNDSIGCSIPGKSLLAKNTIVIDGVTREYNLSLPVGYSKDKRYNLVVAIHGRTNSKDMVQSYMGLQGKSGTWNNRNGTSQTDSIVAYPAGISVKGGYSWAEASSVTFFDAILKQVSSSYCVDRDHVFVVGHSLGGWFANKLACVRGDVLRGMASVGGPGYGGACNGPVASLIYQNSNDQLVPYASGKYAQTVRRDVNTCGAATVNVTIGSNTCKQWKDCSTGNPVTWCEGYPTLQNDPHGWPTAGGVSMLDYFRKL